MLGIGDMTRSRDICLIELWAATKAFMVAQEQLLFSVHMSSHAFLQGKDKKGKLHETIALLSFTCLGL